VTLSRQEAIRRLQDIERELAELRRELDHEPAPDEGPQATQAFLDKCGGWQDARTPEELIAQIYAARTASHRGVDLLDRDDR